MTYPSSPEREKNLIFTLEYKQSYCGKGTKRYLPLLTWTISGEGDVPKIYYPGMFTYKRIPKLAVNAFAQRTRTTEI